LFLSKSGFEKGHFSPDRYIMKTQLKKYYYINDNIIRTDMRR
jgi:hypothetical protein